ncbi:UNVERIFIED_CONTAM: hypothetical protein FKN15_067463 [Acipenser sinensis]
MLFTLYADRYSSCILKGSDGWPSGSHSWTLECDKVYSDATRPIVLENNTDLSGFYSRPADALLATGVAGAR